MTLRFRLLDDLHDALPAACQLPNDYVLEITGDACPNCASGSRRVRTSTRHPIGLMLSCPQVRLIHQECSVCGQALSLEGYHQHVPPKGNYAYDLIVMVGLARFRDHRQDAEIQSDIQRCWGLSLPASSIGLLAHSFLDGLAAIHQTHAPVLRRQLADDGGYAMHVDGTCEPGTDVLFAAMAEPRGWTLEVARMATENKEEISKLMRRGVDRFGLPLAVMRDLSPNIEQAKLEAIPESRDLICHYHFLENVGERLCAKPHATLTAALRRLKVRSALRSIRTDLVRATRNGKRLSTTQIQRLLSTPKDTAELDVASLRRFTAYMLLRWLDDFSADLKGEYFPFDLPSLALYRRGLKLAGIMSELVERPDFPRRGLSTLRTIARHLAPLREDADVVASAARLEKAAALFEQLRKVLRFTSKPHERLLRGRSSLESRAAIEAVEKRLETWRDRLQKRHDRERDTDKRADQATILKYIQKYENQLLGHVIHREEMSEPFVVCRTNNPIEHRFGTTKQAIRRKVGTKKLARQVQAMRPEILLVRNLSDVDYVNLVLNGSLANLPSAFAKYWHQACVIRKNRFAQNTDHPMPTTKKQLRDPQLLDRVKQTITTTMAILANSNHAA